MERTCDTLWRAEVTVWTPVAEVPIGTMEAYGRFPYVAEARMRRQALKMARSPDGEVEIKNLRWSNPHRYDPDGPDAPETLYTKDRKGD